MTYLPGFNSGKERLIPRRLCTTRLAAHKTDFMSITVVGQVDLAIALFANQGTALCCSTCGGIRDSNERQCSTKDQGRGACAARRAGVEGVAHLVGMITNGRHNEVRAINGNHTALGEPRTWVVLLNNRVDAKDGYDNDEDKVKRDEKAVESATGACEVRV